MLVLHFIADIDEKRAAIEKDPTATKTWRPFVMASMYGNPNDPAFDELFALWKAYGWIRQI